MPTDEPMRCRLLEMLDALELRWCGTRAIAAAIDGIIENPIANPRSRSALTTSQLDDVGMDLREQRSRRPRASPCRSRPPGADRCGR